MTSPVERETVTGGGAIESPNSSLALREIGDRLLWSLQPGRRGNLNAFTQALFGAAPQPGEVLRKDSLRLLCLWPHKAWLLASSTGPRGPLDHFGDIATDIGHGYCEFSLGGEHALGFLGSYCSADPAERCGGERRSLRCLLGQYPVVLWWDNIDDIRILVERSHALSFHDYVEGLMARWRL